MDTRGQLDGTSGIGGQGGNLALLFQAPPTISPMAWHCPHLIILPTSLL